LASPIASSPLQHRAHFATLGALSPLDRSAVECATTYSRSALAENRDFESLSLAISFSISIIFKSRRPEAKSFLEKSSDLANLTVVGHLVGIKMHISCALELSLDSIQDGGSLHDCHTGVGWMGNKDPM
jgi:hypothetical protein